MVGRSRTTGTHGYYIYPQPVSKATQVQHHCVLPCIECLVLCWKILGVSFSGDGNRGRSCEANQPNDDLFSITARTRKIQDRLSPSLEHTPTRYINQLQAMDKGINHAGKWFILCVQLLLVDQMTTMVPCLGLVHYAAVL